MIAGSVLSAPAQTDQPIPLASLDAARIKIEELPSLSRMATNTPAFERYAVTAMLKQANEMREKWKLDIPEPLTIDNIVFAAKATETGFEGGIATKDERFHWGFSQSTLSGFTDGLYSPEYWSYKFDPRVGRAVVALWRKDNDPERLVGVKSKISKRQAVRIAHDAIWQLGFTDKALGLVTTAVVGQYDWGAKSVPLPLFRVEWNADRKEDSGVADISVDVSGITERVVAYSNCDPHVPRGQVPTNYLEMLNLPPDFHAPTMAERSKRFVQEYQELKRQKEQQK